MTDTPATGPAATHHHAFNFHTGRPRFHFDESGAGGAAAGAATAGAAGGAAAGAAAASPWHTGIDAEIIGHAQNKGWKLDDPKEAFTLAAKQAREAERFIGADPKNLLKLPKDASDEAGWNGVYQRLGAPADAKDYDFSSVKHADGSAPDAKLIDLSRSLAQALHAPKDRAADITSAIVKHLDGIKQAQADERSAALETEKAALKQSWGAKHEENLLTARQGARRLGVDPETVTKLENEVGYSKIMEMFRKIGAGTSESTFIEGGGGGGNPATREAAIARKSDLMADKAWAGRYLAGGATERREMDSLDRLIAGVAA